MINVLIINDAYENIIVTQQWAYVKKQNLIIHTELAVFFFINSIRYINLACLSKTPIKQMGVSEVHMYVHDKLAHFIR